MGLWATLIGSTNKTLTTSDQRQQVYERLLHRNHIRSLMGVRPIDITKMYHRKVQAMEIAEYEDLLEPYLVDAFANIAWPDSLTGRILIAVRLYKRCVDQVHIDHGVVDPRDRQPNIIAVINRLMPQSP